MQPKWAALVGLAGMGVLALIWQARRGLLDQTLYTALGFSLIINPNVFLGMPNLTHFGGASGFFVSLSDLLVLACLGRTLQRIWNRNPGPQPRPSSGLILFLGVYLLLSLLSLIQATHATLGLAQIVFDIKGITLMLTVGYGFLEYKEGMAAHPVFLGLALALIAETLLVLLEYTHWLPAGFSFLGLQVEGIQEVLGGTVVSRVGGTYRHPNYLAIPMACLVVPMLTLFWQSRSWRRLLNGLALGGATLCLILPLSRAGWVAFLLVLLALGVCFWLTPGSRELLRRYRRSILGGLVLIAAVGAAFSPIIMRKILQSDPMNVQSRMELNEIALEMIRQHPLTGVGINNHSLGAEGLGRYEVYALAFGLPPVVHNIYLLIASEIGIPGLLAFLGVMGTLLMRGFRRLRHPESWAGRMLNMGFLSGALGFLGADMFGPSLRQTEIATLFWWFLGILILLNRKHEQEVGLP